MPVGHTPAMEKTDYSEYTARLLEGEALLIGDLRWPRPEPPLRLERAGMLADAIPPGTIAAGVSAGWVWTGMGIPTPLSLIASRSPAPSPLSRHEWKIRGVVTSDQDIAVVGSLSLLTPEATRRDLWRCPATDEVAVALLFWLGTVPTEQTDDLHAARSGLLRRWRQDYPWATRYTS